MEPSYSEWKEVVNAYNHKRLLYCPYCDSHSAFLMSRYVTNRDGETERQYRVYCPLCRHNGKTYMHESIAEKSWEVRENDPPPKPPRRRRSYQSV